MDVTVKVLSSVDAMLIVGSAVEKVTENTEVMAKQSIHSCISSDTT